MPSSSSSYDRKGRFLRAALRYIKKLGKIFPVTPGSKAPPLVTFGTEASTDETQIRAWWDKWPTANIGLKTGEVVFALDIDPGNGGEESREMLERKHGKLPDTLQQMTPRGGRHFLFKMPDFEVHNSTSAIAPGIDVRGENGYILLCPSVSYAKEYRWDGASTDQPILDAPPWLLELLKNGKGHKPKVERVVPKVIPKGKRHNTLMSVGGTMRRRGCEFAEIFAAMAEINKRCVPTPYPEEHIRQCSEDLCKKDPDTPLTELRRITPPPGRRKDWKDILLRTEDKTLKDGTIRPGKILVGISNGIIALRQAPEWDDVLAFNEFSLQPWAVAETPWGYSGKWDDQQDRLLADWFQHEGIWLHPHGANDAVQTVSRENGFHPVKDYLNGLEWNGEQRIRTWLVDYLGVASTEYSRAVGFKWLLSAIARVFKPGCKADYVLMLEGDQGLRKSMACRALAGDEWFTDNLPDVSDKDAQLAVNGKWIIELSELDAITRADNPRVKSFLSRQFDYYRPPYGHQMIESPRQCIFVGTTNHYDWSTDETGARRYWPIECRKLDIEKLREDRDQLWAEAVHHFHKGELWYFTDSERDIEEQAKHEQERRYVVGQSWEGLIYSYLRDEDKWRPETTVQDVLKMAIDKPQKDWTHSDEIRVGKILRRFGWRPASTIDRPRKYVPPAASVPVSKT